MSNILKVARGWIGLRASVNLNTRPLHPNAKLQGAIPEMIAREFRLVMINYDARSRKLTVGTEGKFRDQVHKKVSEYAQDNSFLLKLSNPMPENLQVVVEVFNPEQIESALKTLYHFQTGGELEHLVATTPIARCLDASIAEQFKVLVLEVFGTTVRCVAEDGPGRDTLVRLFEDRDFREKISDAAFGNSSLWNQLQPAVKFVPKGTVERHLGDIYQLDRKAHAKNVNSAVERLNESTKTKGEVKQREKGEPEQLLTEILGRLAEEKCSDVKISYNFDKDCMEVRARSSGNYREEGSFPMPNEAFKRIIVWVLARISKEPVLRRNHDGSLTFKNIKLPVSKRTIDLATRVSYLPLVDTNHREAECNGRLSFRILSGVSSPLQLEELGYTDAELALVKKISNHRYGFLVFVGEMGSGKSQSATAILTSQKIENPGKDIVSMEQPVEYDNPYIDQVELGQEDDPIKILKSMVRQGINGLFMGEINTREMAEMAISCGMGGVFVISTFHSKDPFTAVQRMAGEPFNVPRADLASCLIGVVFQALATKVCPTCRRRDFDWKERILDDPKHRVSGEQLVEMLKKLEIPTDWEEGYEKFTQIEGEKTWNELPDPAKAKLRAEFDSKAGNNLKTAVRLAQQHLGKSTMPFTFWRDELEQSGTYPFFVPWVADGKLMNGDECPDCVGRGKKPGTGGRTAIPGIWYPTKAEKRMIVQGESDLALREAALRNGHNTVHKAGLDRLLRGVISTEEFFDALGPLNLEDEFPENAFEPEIPDRRPMDFERIHQPVERGGESSRKATAAASETDFIDIEVEE